MGDKEGENDARSRYRKFHGRSVQRQSRIEFPTPKALTFLGEGLAIEYRSDKKLHGTHTKRSYRHEFSHGVKIYAHPNGQWLLVHGGKFRVTDWMRD